MEVLSVPLAQQNVMKNVEYCSGVEDWLPGTSFQRFVKYSAIKYFVSDRWYLIFHNGMMFLTWLEQISLQFTCSDQLCHLYTNKIY